MAADDKKLRVALIGAGRFGAKRAAAVAKSGRSTLALVADPAVAAAKLLASRFGCAATSEWKQAVTREDVNAVIVSTPTHQLAEVSLLAAQAGKHVLAEKPFGRSSGEVLPVVDAARVCGVHLKVGYNHRCHPAIRRAHELFVEGVIGRPVFLRCIYGHGGRVGYETEWRSQAALSGGGELLDQGVHALDLFRWFLGEFEEVAGMVSTAFWPIAPAEDNVFAFLRSSLGVIAELHASWTCWKNTFSFELFGEKGYLRVSGLGGGYGVETLCLGVREGLGEVPREQSLVFSGPDESLAREWEEFADAILGGDKVDCDGLDGLRTLQLAEAIYRAAREGRTARPAEYPELLSNLVT